MFTQLRSGTHFHFADPHVADILLDDIAHALAHTCRYGGHCTRFYSVAEHSIHVMRCVQELIAGTGRASPTAMLRAALMHDAAEAYIGDIPTPIKRHLDRLADGGLKRLEQEIEAVIWRRFDIDPADVRDSVVKHTDSNFVLAAEIEHLLQPVPGDAWAPAEYWKPNGRAPWQGFTLHAWAPGDAKREFLTACASLGIV